MKLLIYEWNSYLQYDLYEICKEFKIEFDVFTWKFENKNQDEEFSAWFRNNIDVNRYDALLSVNYYPILSEECALKNLKYLAWCYDAPLNVERIEETLGNEINSVFLFDRAQYSNYYSKGYRTVYHLPLGVNRTRLGNLQITHAQRANYSADVAFVGRLYESEIQGIVAPMNDYSKGYIKCMMDMQSQIYGYFLLEDGITEEFIKNVNQQYREANPETKLVLNKEALLFAMASEITRKDRLILLNLCGKRYDTRFYSCDDSPLLENVKKCGPLDYVKEMPQMFACSKINLNPSLRIIKTGIPMRALDIMGAGGFLLSNWQEELVEFYENEQEMVVYESYEDAVAKIDFYIKHEDLREKIAQRGRIKTLEQHSLQQCLQNIINCAGI